LAKGGITRKYIPPSNKGIITRKKKGLRVKSQDRGRKPWADYAQPDVVKKKKKIAASHKGGGD